LERIKFQVKKRETRGRGGEKVRVKLTPERYGERRIKKFDSGGLLKKTLSVEGEKTQ